MADDDEKNCQMGPWVRHMMATHGTVMMKKINGWSVGLGVLALPGTPRVSKSHLFGTNRVAIQPFCISEAGFDAEFRRGSRQIDPTPSNSIFFNPFLLMLFGFSLKKIDVLIMFSMLTSVAMGF